MLCQQDSHVLFIFEFFCRFWSVAFLLYICRHICHEECVWLSSSWNAVTDTAKGHKILFSSLHVSSRLGKKGDNTKDDICEKEWDIFRRIKAVGSKMKFMDTMSQQFVRLFKSWKEIQELCLWSQSKAMILLHENDVSLWVVSHFIFSSHREDFCKFLTLFFKTDTDFMSSGIEITDIIKNQHTCTFSWEWDLKKKSREDVNLPSDVLLWSSIQIWNLSKF